MKEEIEEFKQIALKEYGVKLTDEQAFEQGYALVSLVETVIKKTIEKRKKLAHNRSFSTFVIKFQTYQKHCKDYQTNYLK